MNEQLETDFILQHSHDFILLTDLEATPLWANSSFLNFKAINLEKLLI